MQNGADLYGGHGLVLLAVGQIRCERYFEHVHVFPHGDRDRFNYIRRSDAMFVIPNLRSCSRCYLTVTPHLGSQKKV